MAVSPSESFRRPSTSQSPVDGHPPQRRFSILNHLGIGKPAEPEQSPVLRDYEVVESAFELPADFGRRPDSQAHAKQFKDFFSKQEPFVSPFDRQDGASSDEDAGDWISPESWGVLPPPKMPTERVILVDNPECSDLWVIRVFRPDIRRMSRDFSAIPALDNDGLMYVTVSGPLDTIAADLYPALARKFFGGSDIGRYRLFVQHAGLETMLDDEALPFQMQKDWFEEIGYSGREEVNKAVSQEHSYVCRFSLKDLPSASRPVLRRDSTNSYNTEIMSSKYALLGNLNLSVVPVDLFVNATTLETIDLSRNTLLSLPEDLFKRLQNLRLLILRENLLAEIPKAILEAPTITNLDLSSNRLNGDSLVCLKEMTSLVSLNLTSNQIEHLPNELASLTNLQSLILSTNILTRFEPVLFQLPKLRELDLCFNKIDVVPSDIKKLSNLQCLILTGNSLTEISSEIQKCRNLKSLDIRGNLLQDLKCIYKCECLLDLRADYNHINSIEDPNWPKMVELSLSNNNLCKVEFDSKMNHLRILDLSGNRIGLLPDDFFTFTPNAEYVNLNENQLTALPESLSDLGKLVKFTAAKNQLAECTFEFAKMSKLKILDLHNNNLKRLSNDFWMAPVLTLLNLSSNFFSCLPTPPNQGELPLCSNLEELYMGENQCRNEIFLQLANCKELRRLNLSMNDIYDFPNGLSCFERLTELYLSHNQLSSLPDDINRLSRLKVLCVNNNRLSTLPGELCECKELRVLDASSNTLRFNVANVPYDWNWRRNVELQYLSLADNPKLDINPTGQTPMAAAELAHFKGLSKLRSLNLTNIRVKPDSVPEETTSLRVRTTWSDIAGYKVGVAEMCGRRMRFDVFDFTVGKLSDDAESDCLFGVFDGKGSANVSNYLYQYFPTNLHSVMAGEGQGDVERSLRLSFLSSNADLSTQPIELRAGSTATILYVQENKIYIANAGDTIAVLSREGRALELSSKHFAWNRAETDRLRSLGGHISMNGLVEGEVELTRAIGYLHLLPFINALPSIRQMELTDQDEFVIIASGSLWRAIPMQTAVDIVRKDSSDLAVAAQRIRDLALAYAAHPDDSLIVMVIGLKQRRSTEHQPAQVDPLMSRRRRIREDIQDSTLARLPKEIDPPTGSLAMVFTDIRDSTVLWETLTAPMRVAKKMHHMIMRRSLRNIGGYEVKTEGDAFMVAFPDAAKAVRWCLNVQQELLDADWPPELLRSPICGAQKSPLSGRLLYKGISVRMGIHFGEMECEQDMVTGRMDYNGVPVIIASRIQSQALGGQILVSDECKKEFDRLLAENDEDARQAERTLKATFIDVGLLRLKGIEAREHVFALYPESLVERFIGPPDGAIPAVPSEPPKSN